MWLEEYVPDMEHAPHIRRATAADVPALSRMLARAFLDDPVAGWSCPWDALRPSSLERFQAIRLRQLLVHEEVWTTDELDCAALWAPPSCWRTTLREDAALIRMFNHPRLLTRMPLVGLGWLKLESGHPTKPPHWYLAVLGTEPASQGRGLGSQVLGAVLDQCDHDGVGAFLESSKESNIDFYARHGFRVTEEVKLVRGPSMWKMWREPRS